MYALKVSINNAAPIIAGADDLGVLNAIVSCVGMLGSSSVSKRGDDSADMSITVGGLTSRAPDVADEHLHWVSHQSLRIGDVISVEVVDTRVVDAPISGKHAEKRRHDEREYYEHCKKVYLSLSEKYEAQ